VSAEFEELRDNLRRYGRASDEIGARRIRDAAMAVRERFAGMMAETASATDPSGRVQATVRLSGSVESVYISPHAVRELDTSGLGRACLSAVRAARERAAGVLADRIQDVSGARPGDQVRLEDHYAELRRLTEG
jgi:DNA-binding protein YbaB